MTADEAIQKAALAYLPATYKRILQHLEDTPCTTDQIAAHLGMTLGSAYKLVSALRDLRVIAIVEFRRLSTTGSIINVWGLGERNATRPKKLTQAERAKRWRAKSATPTLGVWGL